MFIESKAQKKDNYYCTQNSFTTCSVVIISYLYIKFDINVAYPFCVRKYHSNNY